MTNLNDSPDPRPLRLWPAVVIVALMWIAAFVPKYIAPGTTWQFFGMMGGPLVGVLLLILWWTFFSRAVWRERLIGLVIFIVSLVAAFTLSHETVPMALMVVGIPILSLATVAWLVLARGFSVSTRRLGAAIVILVSCLGWTLMRTDGVDGTMGIEYGFRWGQTAEEKLLATGDTTPKSDPSVDPLGEPLWPAFRGPERDSRISGIFLQTAWSENPPQEIWRRPIGPGWGSYSVVGNRLFTQEQRGEEEIVACYDADSGEPLWQHRNDARFWEVLAGPGPRATPTYHEGRIYALGATGIMDCLDAANGRLIWSRELIADTGASLPDWGFSSSPLIVDDVAIVYSGAADGKAVVAYDLATGEPRWFAPTGPVSYSSPHLATIDDVRQVLILTDAGATSLDPVTGLVLWDHEWPLPGGSRCIQPVVTEDGHVMIGTGFGMGVRSIQVTRSGSSWSTEESWTSRGLKPYYNDMVEHRGHLYGFDGSILASINATTGDKNWKRGRYGHGQLLLLVDQDLLLVLSEKGEVVLVDADPEEFREVARISAIEGKTWNHPVVVGDRLYVRNGEEAAAFRLPLTKTPERAADAYGAQTSRR